VLPLSKTIVPPLWVEGLTAALIAAFYPADVDVGVGLLLPPQAASPSAAATPTAANGSILFRFID